MASKKSAIMKKKSRSGKKTTSKPIPANRYLRYRLTNSSSAGTETSHFIDLARDLSAINRKLMRQGRCYHVKRISIVSTNTIAGHTHVDQSEIPGVSSFTQPAGFVSFSVAPDTWVTRNAWKRGFESFKLMNEAATPPNMDGNLKAKWQDFKVYLSDDHRTSGNILRPVDNKNNEVSGTGASWDYTVLESPDGVDNADSFNVHLLGGHVAQSGSAAPWTTIGLIKSYGESRLTVSSNDPNGDAVNVHDPLLNLFDAGTQADEVITRLLDTNDDPPYALAHYPGDNNNLPGPQVVQQTTLGADGRASVGGFSAMCGLIEIESTSPVADDLYSILVELAPGKYRGIAADVI
jgi:hypothetical protein